MTIISLLKDPTLTDTEWAALYRYFDFYGLIDEPEVEPEVQTQSQDQQKYVAIDLPRPTYIPMRIQNPLL